MIQFNPDTHQYQIDGEPAIGVNELIQWYGLKDVSQVPQDILDKAATRGKYVHSAIKLYLENNLDEASLHPEILPYFQAFLKFTDDYNLVTQAQETMVGSKEHMVVGTYDWRGGVNTKHTLVDWKTSSRLSIDDALQLEGYRFLHMINTTEVPDIMLVQLKKNGKYFVPPPEFYPKDGLLTFTMMAELRMKLLRYYNK